MTNKVNYTFDISELTGYSLSIEPATLAVETLGIHFSAIKCLLYTDLEKFDEFINTFINSTVHSVIYSYEKKMTPKQKLYIGHYPEKSEKNTFLLEAKTTGYEYIVVNIFFQQSNVNIIEEIVEKLHNKFPNLQSGGKVNIITNQSGVLELTEFEVEQLEIDLKLNYGDKFLETNELIVNNIVGKNKGIVLLHGDPGTGKTSYIKHLITTLGEKKKIIYVPPDMTSSLSDPGLISFLSEHKNSVLIIEDAENIIKSRKNGHNQTVSNLLNLSDGILSDLLKIQIVCTFNCEVADIDSALLRKGRLIALHKFEPLSKEDSQRLVDSLKLEYIVTGPMTLADIYNLKQKSFVPEKRNIGFAI
jgi:hypothetical protein